MHGGNAHCVFVSDVAWQVSPPQVQPTLHGGVARMPAAGGVPLRFPYLPTVVDAMGAVEFGQFLSFSLSPLEIIIRGTLMYWFLFLIFRFVLRRDTASAGITDILFVVLLGDAAQNAMIGSGQTVADGVALILTLVFWNYLLDYLGFRFELVSRLTDPPAILLVRNGRLQGRNLRREHLTTNEIEAKLRSEGVDDVLKVKAMYLENDGSFSVVKKPSH
jgi:uncharacterized membrane protein YcaP (DUF421 family)